MIPSSNDLGRELVYFADLGTDPPKCVDRGDQITVAMVRGGNNLSLKFNKSSGRVVEDADGGANQRGPVQYHSYRALLASESFGNLGAWADAQKRVLRQAVNAMPPLPVRGEFSTRPDNAEEGDYDAVSSFLETSTSESKVRVLLIDGPAGIGKTHIITRLARDRADAYRTSGKPLILIVSSRGRVLSYLSDLMAYSLQTMRLTVTYDQVPILVRHGLVQLAIDGFDELGDPNGYENAWAQLRDTVEDISGAGTLILAGRETFIGRERLYKAVPLLGIPPHTLAVFNVKPPTPQVAEGWLSGRLLPPQIKELSEWGLFDEDSYGLRPFFLAQIAEIGQEADAFNSRPPLMALVERMLDREAGKFPDEVSCVLGGREQTIDFIRRVLCEAARDIAENQTDSVDQDILSWIVDAELGDGFDSGLGRVVKNRIIALAFLQNDERPDRRRFCHSEFYNYFLSHAAISALARGEIPKFVRRTILGNDFLIGFAMVLAILEPAPAVAFLDATTRLLDQTTGLDRTSRNLGALLVAGLPVAGCDRQRRIEHVDIDDSIIRGIAEPSHLVGVTINQLDLREADISAVTFKDCHIVTLIADETTRVSPTFPDVGWIQVVGAGREKAIRIKTRIEEWLEQHGRVKEIDEVDEVRHLLWSHELPKLLWQVCRATLRQHWLRPIGDPLTAKFFRNPWWPELERLLRKHDLFVERDDLPTSGPPGSFYHIKQARSILEQDYNIPQIDSFFDDLKEAARK